MPPDIRRALEVLAGARQGRSADVLAYEVGPEVLPTLVRAGLASETVEHLAVPGGQPIKITRVRITDAGPQALAEHHKRDGAPVRITMAGRRKNQRELSDEEGLPHSETRVGLSSLRRMEER